MASGNVQRTFKLDDAAWAKINEMLDRPAVAHPALVALFSEPDPFALSQERCGDR